MFNNIFKYDILKENKPVDVLGLNKKVQAAYVWNLFDVSKKNILVVTNTLYEANSIYKSITLTNQDDVLLFPMDDFLVSEMVASSPDLMAKRIETLNELVFSNSKKIVITNIMGYLRFLPCTDLWKGLNITLKVNDTFLREELIKKLNMIGYKKESIVTKTGEYANRGYILDVFPYGYDNPIRIEFFDDEIDNIREFNPTSQLSTEKKDSITIMPFTEFINEKEIFPDNEDTVLSKLQNKVIKLYKILKNRSIREEQEHENIKKLVSDISHQLKTPIANLKMYSSFLNDVQLTARQQKEYIDIICLSVERLNFLSENIIKVSRLESGIIQLKMQEQSLNGTILKAVKDIYSKAQQQGIEIQYNEIDKIELKHDRNWTAEAIFNILDNAVKYGNNGNTVYMSVRCIGMFAEISVRDENSIIPYEERNNVFTRFYRGKNSNGKEGLGVGLYLTREIIVKQGGYINLRTSGSGNIFTIMLYRETN